jgi:phenylalanyl-tRNA synthetase beta chain
MISRLSPDLSNAGPEPLKVAHPMSRELECLRTTLRPGLLSTLGRNQRYQEFSIKLFETGKVFLPQSGELPYEQEMICGIISSAQPVSSWREKEEQRDFYAIKGVVETIVARFGLSATFKDSGDASFSLGKCANVMVGNEVLGVLGELHPVVSQAYDLNDHAFLFELNLEKLLSQTSTVKEYQPVPRYPSTYRDIALLVDHKVQYEQINQIIKEFPLVDQVTLFDVYSGKQVQSDKKSLAFRIIFQSSTQTLTDTEIDHVQQQILEKLNREIGAILRA